MDAKQEKLAALRDKLAEMRSVTACPHCGRTVRQAMTHTVRPAAQSCNIIRFDAAYRDIGHGQLCPLLIKGRGVRRLQRKKQNFIQGAFILMLASLLVKVIGAFFQIPLLNMIGGKDSPAFGMFSAAYRVYTAMLMISTVGVPAALAKMVAEATARGREHEVRRTVRVAGSIFIPLGAVCSVVLFLGAGTFAILDQERGFPAGGYGHRTECADGC